MLRSANCAAIALLGCWGSMAAAQAGRVYTATDYARAESRMDYGADPLVYHTVRDPVWLDNGRFWYRDYGPEGVTYTLVDLAKRTKGAAFDQGKLRRR